MKRSKLETIILVLLPLVLVAYIVMNELRESGQSHQREKIVALRVSERILDSLQTVTIENLNDNQSDIIQHLNGKR